MTVVRFDARDRVHENDRLVRRQLRRTRWRRRLDDVRFWWRARLARVRFSGDRVASAALVFGVLTLALAINRVPLGVAAAFAASLTLNLVAIALRVERRR